MHLIHFQDGNINVKFVFRILEKIHVGYETGYGSETNQKVESGTDSDPKKSFRIHNTATTATNKIKKMYCH
jgi:hypothetical protein